jgi:predicted trehalose synthase
MAAQDPRWSAATRAVHVSVPPPDEQPVAPPLYQTSTFAFSDAARYAEALTAPDSGFSYTRYHNPTTGAFERALADLFLLQKGVYEIGYELANRPTWVKVPLRGIQHFLSMDADR